MTMTTYTLKDNDGRLLLTVTDGEDTLMLSNWNNYHMGFFLCCCKRGFSVEQIAFIGSRSGSIVADDKMEAMERTFAEAPIIADNGGMYDAPSVSGEQAIMHARICNFDSSALGDYINAEELTLAVEANAEAWEQYAALGYISRETMLSYAWKICQRIYNLVNPGTPYAKGLAVEKWNRVLAVLVDGAEVWFSGYVGTPENCEEEYDLNCADFFSFGSTGLFNPEFDVSELMASWLEGDNLVQTEYECNDGYEFRTFVKA